MKTEKAIRAAKIGYIALSAVFCAMGMLLILFPDMSVSVVGVVVGAMLVAFGAVKLAGYFSKDLYQLAFQFDLAFGVLLMALGVVVLLSPDRALTSICFVMGVAVLADGLFKLQSSLDARRFGLKVWGLLLALAICAGVIGLLLLVQPGKSARVLMRLMGVGTLFEGLLNLYFALFAVKFRRRGQEEATVFWNRNNERRE